jgi:hypothetical protein
LVDTVAAVEAYAVAEAIERAEAIEAVEAMQVVEAIEAVEAMEAIKVIEAIDDGMYGEVRVVLCVLRYRVGAYGDGNRLSPNRLDSQVHAHMSRNLRAIEHYLLQGA